MCFVLKSIQDQEGFGGTWEGIISALRYMCKGVNPKENSEKLHRRLMCLVYF